MTKHIFKYSFAVIVLIYMFTIICRGEFKNKYDWLPSECASENYPMRIVSGDLILPDGSSVYVPSKAFIDNGWGEIGSTHVVGDDKKPLPVRLSITWFSFVEDKFYSGEFKLPEEKIRNLFKAGFVGPKTGKNITYQRIIVGVAPEGELSVWLAAEGVVLEVATFKAVEITGDWKTILDNPEFTRAGYVNSVLEDYLSKDQIYENHKHGIPKGIFESYRRQHPWNLEIIGSNPTECWIKTYNGEYEVFKYPRQQNIRITRAVPKMMRVHWRNSFGTNYVARVYFDEQEIFKAYQKLNSMKSQTNMMLRLVIDEKNETVRMFLRDSQYILKLEKITTEVNTTD